MFNFSKYNKLPISGHKDICFVDVPVETDIKLFLDPGLIEAGTDQFSRQCAEVVKSFFDAVFNCCLEKDYIRLASLLNHSAEPNETHLGHSVLHSQGRGASVNILFTVFQGMIKQGLFETGAILHPCDILVLAPNFDKDRMSDLLTNILREQLQKFTAKECLKLGIPMSEMRDAWSWDLDKMQWKKNKLLFPAAYGQPVMLVPKQFVCNNYHFDTSSYISKYLLEYRQKYHLDNHTGLCYERELKDGRTKLMPPTKEVLKTKELVGISWKQHASGFAYSNPDTMRQFGVERENIYANGSFFMTDTELDHILYSEKYRTA